MKKIVFCLILAVLGTNAGCDLSGILGLRPKAPSAGTGFKSIVATAKPIYLKTTYDGWNMQMWSDFKAQELSWYDRNDIEYNGNPYFTSNLTTPALTTASSVLRSKDIRDGRQPHHTLSFTAVDRVNGLTMNEAIVLLNGRPETKTPASEYILGDQIKIKINSSNHRNDYSTSSYRTIHEQTSVDYYFAIDVETSLIASDGSTIEEEITYNLQAKEFFPYRYIRVDNYVPSGTLEYESIVCQLDDNAKIITFDAGELIESYQISSSRLTINLKDREASLINTPYVGHVFDVKIQSGTSENITNHSLTITRR